MHGQCGTLGTMAVSPAHSARQGKNVACTSEEILTLGLTRDTLVSAWVHTRRVKAGQRAGWGLQKGVPRRV